MIGMDFISFLILLIISVVVAAILHYGLKYYVTPWILVILFQGGRGLAWCVDRLACPRSLAFQNSRSSPRGCLYYPSNPWRGWRAYCSR